MADLSGSDPGHYDSLLDAERVAAESDGERPTKITLIARLRKATGLGLREAKDAVEGYLTRRAIAEGGKPGWVDSFLDAEREAARREERPLTRLMLVRALREASDLDLRGANLAVSDYLRRRGARLPSGIGPAPIVIGVLALIGAGLAYVLIAG